MSNYQGPHEEMHMQKQLKKDESVKLDVESKEINISPRTPQNEKGDRERFIATKEIKIEINQGSNQQDKKIGSEVPKDDEMQIGKMPRETNSLHQKRILVQLTWNDIVVVPKDQIEKQCCGNQPNYTDAEVKKILNHVSGTVKPNQFLAIIGASGIYLYIKNLIM